MRARMAFDTLAYANRLKAAGVDSKMAEAQAEANAEMVAALLNDGLVTRQDLLEFKSEFEKQTSDMKSGLEDKISGLDNKMNDIKTGLEDKIHGINIKLILARLTDDFSVIMAGNPDIHTHLRPAQQARILAGVFERLPRGLEHHPLLRVHGDGFAHCDTEERRIELIDAIEEPGVPHGLSRWPVLGSPAL